MAFEGLAEKLQNIFQKLTRRGKLTDLDIKAAMRKCASLFWKRT